MIGNQLGPCAAAEDIEELAQLVGNEYGIETSEVYEDVKNVVKTFREKGILL